MYYLLEMESTGQTVGQVFALLFCFYIVVKKCDWILNKNRNSKKFLNYDYNFKWVLKFF